MILDIDEIPVPQVDVPVEYYDDRLLFAENDFAANPRKKARAIALTPQKRAEMTHYYQLGIDGLGWYEMMWQDFLQVFGNAEDAELYILMLAATSPNNDVKSNVFYALKGYAQCKLGITLKKFDKQEKTPPGVFKGYMTGHYDNVVRACQGDRNLSGPKVLSFYQAMMGDERAVVIDRWMIRALGEKVQVSDTAMFTLKDRCQLKGKARKYRQGYLVQLDEASVMTCKERGKPSAQFLLFETDIMSQIRERGEGEYYIPLSILMKEPGFAEKKLTALQYRRFADAATRLADELGVAPRDYQAAVWTGIKIERDPTGLANFVTFYRDHFGDDPPNLAFMEQFAAAPGYVPQSEGDTPLLASNPEIDASEQDMQVLNDAAEMLQ